MDNDITDRTYAASLVGKEVYYRDDCMIAKVKVIKIEVKEEGLEYLLKVNEMIKPKSEKHFEPFEFRASVSYNMGGVSVFNLYKD